MRLLVVTFAILGWCGVITSFAQTLKFYVAPNGNDEWSGRLPTPNARRTDGPFATLHRARDAIRELKRQGKFPKNGVIVEIRGGVYELSTPIELTAEDSGLPNAPIIYRARKGEIVRLLAGKQVTNWQKVTDREVLSRLDENVRDKIWQANLKALGITDFGSPAWDWSDQRHRLKSIDPEKRILEVEPPYHYYGYRKGQWFYAYNILAELDSPGEWYLDRETGTIYFYPPTDIAKGETIVSVLPMLLIMRDVSHVRWEGFVMEGARGTVAAIYGGSDVRIAGCVIRNSGGWAVIVEGGTNHAIVSCDIYGLGEGGIALSGGDRKTLTPANHLAENNHIRHYARWHRMYRPAIALNGVGNKARHNYIHDAPHQAISFSGNEHLIEFNLIERVCLESNDAGAIYSGRDWTWRGTIIRFNLFRDITGFEKRGCMGVYLDDMLCGTIVFGNIFERVTRAAFIGGGRDNIVENNIFVDCLPAVHVDARAMGWASYHVDTTMKERLMAVPYKQPPWSERYPQLVNILEDEPAAPKGNIIRRNICVGGRWIDIEEKAKPYVLIEGNLIDVDPQVLFMNASKGDYRLKANSPAVKIGFKPIPLERIGLYRDEWRANLLPKPLHR